MLSARRVTLDAVLIEAAAAAGAEVRTQTAVTGLIEDRGRVVGLETKSGELRAPLVVGADGVRSAVARLVGAAKYDQTPAGRLFTWAYFEGAQAEDGHMWLGAIGDHSFLAFPTDAGLFMAAVVPSIERREEVLADRQAAFAGELPHWPELESVLGGAQRVGVSSARADRPRGSDGAPMTTLVPRLISRATTVRMSRPTATAGATSPRT